tara:strand:+ start:1053 stop:1238 length:186 start_codon:yes stop_codon:yes gene_type:complete
MQVTRWAASRALPRAGRSMDISSETMLMTTSNSMSVKARMGHIEWFVILKSPVIDNESGLD